MKFFDLRRGLIEWGVSLSETAEGKLHYDAPKGLPTELLDAMREYRAALLRQVQEGRTPDGRLDLAHLSTLPGRCASCARWTPTPYPMEGECSAGRRAHGWTDGKPDAPVLTHPAHQCAVLGADARAGHRLGRSADPER